MSTYYFMMSNKPTNEKNITEEQHPQVVEQHSQVVEQHPQETSSSEKAEISENSRYKEYWNSDMDTDLIKLIKEEECLWNVYSEKFNHKKYKLPAIERVVREMKRLWPNREQVITQRKCLLKFRNLRTYYMRERKKQINGKLKNEHHRVIWQHYDDMSFISDKIPFKIENVESTHTPIIIQFPSNYGDSPHDVTEVNMDVSSFLEQENSCSAEDQVEEIPSKAKKKLVVRPKLRATSSNFSSKAQKANGFKSSYKLKGFSHRPNKSNQCIAQVVPSNSNLPGKLQNIEMTHDEAFANFIAKDLGKIPEGKQKEQLRFKILELIHHCKMDTNTS